MANRIGLEFQNHKRCDEKSEKNIAYVVITSDEKRTEAILHKWIVKPM